ncbi:SUKH-3 domain-containing protein [Dactylosporangium roseum]|uniref:SUKH-3 domain-containing protein n=1 Tax=Dactylosporangium roseum TaxID=47989 RepID=A0ABY5ZAK7_9ACTN|nr:SUKH-3 domain-containing protein [Dactylosporangium roseum]UWZ38897.1 SUKH-3 domain-containing protein [Dactylosporangium roseum]
MSTPERFPSEVAEVLARAGWTPGRNERHQARMWALALASHASPDGHQHTVVPPAMAAFAEFGGLAVRGEGAGEQVAPPSFVLDPMRALHSASTLAELGTLVGARMTPLGEEGDGTGLLAVDERGRVFLVDHTADWFLGATLDEALCTLVAGRMPARVSDEGTWA